MGRPSPPRAPPPPQLALIQPSRRSPAGPRNSSSNSILSLGIEWFSEVQNERARKETNHEKSAVRIPFIAYCAPLGRANGPGRSLAGYDGEWRHVSSQLLALAEAMPEEKFA